MHGKSVCGIVSVAFLSLCLFPGLASADMVLSVGEPESSGTTVLLPTTNDLADTSIATLTDISFPQVQSDFQLLVGSFTALNELFITQVQFTHQLIQASTAPTYEVVMQTMEGETAIAQGFLATGSSGTSTVTIALDAQIPNPSKAASFTLRLDGTDFASDQNGKIAELSGTASVIPEPGYMMFCFAAVAFSQLRRRRV